MTDRTDVEFARLVVNLTAPSLARARLNLAASILGPLMFGCFGFQTILDAAGIHTWCPWWVAMPLAWIGLTAALVNIIGQHRRNKILKNYNTLLIKYLDERGIDTGNE